MKAVLMVAGLLVGVVVGGILGMLIGIGALAIPGLGPLVAAGSLATMFGTMAIGALLGALVGGCAGMILGVVVERR